VHLADAASLPFPDGAFDLVVAFMSLEVTFVSEHQPLEATRTRSRALGSASNG
jgi:ubiquinone/menaquinone biosynthesis C-methylase UbiE